MKKESKGITLIALVITIIVLLILAGVTIATLTGDNGLLSKAGQSKTASEESELREEINLLLLQAKMGDSLENIFKDGTVSKDGSIYEISYKSTKFLVDKDYEYIELVEPQYEGEWSFNQNTQTLTTYNGDLTTKRGNQEIGEVIIPNYYNGKRVKKINYDIFMNNTNLTKLKISEGIEIIDQGVFYGCNNLTGNLIIPKSVTSIGYRAFKKCSSLSGNLKFSNNLETIGTEAFCGCSSLTGDLIIPDNVTEIYSGAFSGCSGFDGKLKLSNNLQTITAAAFENCSNLTGELVIPDSVTTIGNRAFNSCGFSGNLKLSNNLQSIGSHAFRLCSGITGEIVLPITLVSLGEQAIAGTGASSIKFLNKDTEIIGDTYSIRPESIKLIGYSGSTAEAYATMHNRTFEVISE